MAKTKPAPVEKKGIDWREFEIDETYEYDVFERMPGNRPVDEQHVIKLMKLIGAKDLKVPIQINQEFQVIDGQHRLEARRRLKYPVYFFVTSGYGLEEVQTINASAKRWTNDDFVTSFVELGKADYQIYKWFRSQYPLPHNQTCILLAGGTESKSLRNTFVAGQFKVKDLKGAKEKAEMLLQIQPYFNGYWNNSRFVHAMLFILNKKVFQFPRLLEQLKKYPTMLKPQATTDLYIQHIEDVYNYQKREKVSLRYGEDIVPRHIAGK